MTAQHPCDPAHLHPQCECAMVQVQAPATEPYVAIKIDYCVCESRRLEGGLKDVMASNIHIQLAEHKSNERQLMDFLSMNLNRHETGTRTLGSFFCCWVRSCLAIFIFQSEGND